MTRFGFCLFASLFLLSACETIPSEPKSVEYSTTQTSEATLPMMTPAPLLIHEPVPHCERFMSSMEQAENILANQPAILATKIDAL